LGVFRSNVIRLVDSTRLKVNPTTDVSTSRSPRTIPPAVSGNTPREPRTRALGPQLPEPRYQHTAPPDLPGHGVEARHVPDHVVRDQGRKLGLVPGAERVSGAAVRGGVRVLIGHG
jgi:hypothetical protein